MLRCNIIINSGFFAAINPSAYIAKELTDSDIMFHTFNNVRCKIISAIRQLLSSEIKI